jgi:PrtD family type I secretion system ABC transporter
MTSTTLENARNPQKWGLLGFGGGTFFSVFAFSCVVNILMLTGPLFMLQVYDRVLASGSVPTLLALSAIVLVLYVYYGFLEYIRSRIMVRVGRKFEEGLRHRVFDVMSQLTLRRAANVGGQPISDLNVVRQYLSSNGPLAFFDMPWVPIYLLIVFMLHFWLGVAGLVAAIVIFALAVWTEASTRTPLGKANVAQAKAVMMTDEARRSAEAMHALGMRGVLRSRWASVQQEALDYQTVASDAGGKLSAASRVVRLLVQSGMLALGAYLAIKGEISPGAIIASSIIMGRGLAPIEQAVGNWQQFLGARKAMDRLVKVLGQVPPEAQRMQLPAPKSHLDVENLVVMVPGQEKPILAGLSFKVEPGQGLGVIGPTGAGKSTLARVLTGVIPATRGAVRLDGASIEQRSVDDYGSIIGYLPQDVQLFDGTVAQNISRFQDNAKPEDIVAAAQIANVHDMVTRLPQGYDTPLGENGARLSSGQKQRVALARALFGNPALIIMDEPNSNLDAEGEVALDRAIRLALQRGAAVVVVAHRPSALQAVSHLLVLNEGKAAVYGPRDEVLKKVTRSQSPPAEGQQQPQQLAARLPQPNNPITRN